MEHKILSFILNSIDNSFDLKMLGEEIRALQDTLVLELLIKKTIDSKVLTKILEFIDKYDDNDTLGFIVSYNRNLIFFRYSFISKEFVKVK